MKLLAHRGMWNSTAEQNLLSSLTLPLSGGLGIETDVRDLAGTLVISHDPPSVHALRADQLVHAIQSLDGDGMLALNVKADGLAALCERIFHPVISRCFFFDMSVPDTRAYVHRRLPFYTRHSDIEPVPAYYEHAAGVWLDELHAEWITAEVIEEHLRKGKKVAVVSSELHGRGHERLWEHLYRFHGESAVALCTDFVELAQEVFR